MTAGKIIAIRETLAQVSETLPFQTAYKIARFCKATEGFSASFEEKRSKILLEYAQRNEEGGFSIPQEKIEETQKKLDDLALQDYDGEVVTFTPEELEELSLTPAEAYNLLEIIKE